MKQVADITLIENSTAGNPPKIFAAQTVEFFPQNPVSQMGADGTLSYGSQLSKIIWHGGTSAEMEKITDVKIQFANGRLIESRLNHNWQARDLRGAIEFFIMLF